MKHLKFYDPSIVCQVAECYFHTYFPFTDDSVRFKMGVFLEAVEELGQHKLVPYIKQIVEVLLSEIEKGDNTLRYHMERPMRTLVAIVQPSDEDWLLKH